MHCRTVLPLGVHDCPECSGAASSGVRADGSSSRGAPWLLLDAVVVLRGWMVLFAVVAILVLFALVLFVDERHVQPWGVEYGFLAVEAALLVAGLFLLTSHPVAWVVASGTVVTIDAARILATGDVPVMRLAIAGALWLGLPTARWVQQLVTRDPSSYVARALAGTPSEWRKARGDEKGAGEILQQSRKRALVRGLVSGFVVLALAIGAAAWRVAGIERRPEPVVEEPRSFGELAAEFDRAWRASDVEALGELCGEDGVEARGELREGLARRGWRGALPPIRGQRLETGALNAELVLTLDAGEARARLGAKSVGRTSPRTNGASSSPSSRVRRWTSSRRASRKRGGAQIPTRCSHASRRSAPRRCARRSRSWARERAGPARVRASSGARPAPSRTTTPSCAAPSRAESSSCRCSSRP
ncbi:MAG: hypothetical protein IPJ77_05040 [Planctomycetes bacterium]|nr:hypothetical protein [Planctomycetota bacterium]